MAIDAGTIYSAIRVALDKLTGDLKTVDSLYDQLGKTIGDKSTQTEKKVNKSLENINIAHIALFAAIAVYVKKSVSDYAAFEQSLANVQAVARASAEDMKLLEEAASEAGQTTKFTGAQAADAIYYLASAGFTARQSMEALDGVLALASATGADLAFTSETVASAISQFGLEAKDAQKVANVFAAGAAASQASIDKLAVSMRYVGPVAAAFNYSIESVTGTLAILYNAGFDASQAGTALRGMLADLSNAASPAIDKLAALGIAFEDVNPAANSLSEVIAALNPIAENGGKIMEVFGDRAGPAMIKLLQAGAGEIEKYTERVTGTSEATEAAAIQNDTLQFSLSRLSKGFGSIGKSITEEFAPALKNAANFLANVLFKISEMPAPLKILLGVLASGVVVFTGLTGAISLFGVSVAAIAGPLAIAIGAISALAAGSVLLHRAYNQTEVSTKNLKKAHSELETNTNNLKTSVENYRKANEELNDKTKDLNDTEKTTLKQRKELSALEITANLGKTIKSINDLKKAQDTSNKSIKKYESQIKNINDILIKLRETEIQLTKEKQEGVSWSSVYGQVTAAIKYYTATIKDNEKALARNTTALYNAKLAQDNANKSRQESVDYLAAAVNMGQITIQQIEIYDKALAKEITTRAGQIKKIEEQTAATNKNNETKKTSIELTSEEIEANERLQKTIQKTKEQLEDLNATELEKIELDRARAIAEIKASESSIKLQNEAIAAINAYYDALKKKTIAEVANEKALEDTEKRVQELDIAYAEEERMHNAIREAVARVQEQRKADEGLAEKAQGYIDKLKEMTDRNYDVLEAERAKEEAAIRAAGGSDEAMQAAIDSLNEYYAALKEKTAVDEFIKNMKDITSIVVGGFQELLSTLSDISDIQAQQQIDAIDRVAQAQMDAIDDQIEAEYGKNDELLKAQMELLDAQLQAALEAAGVAEDTAEEKLQKEIAAAYAKNDLELAAEKEKELLRLQITQDYEARKKALEDQAVIDKQAAEDAKTIIEEEAARKTADLKYKADHAGWVADNWVLAGKALLAQMNAWTSPFWAIEVPLVTTATLALIYKQKLTEPQPPPAFQTGGIVLGSQQGTIIRAGENNTSDLLLSNSEAGRAMIYEVADAIASRMQGQGGVPAIVNIYLSENLIAQSVVRLVNDGVYTIQQRGVE
jgi:TP901 family phage tail tape measure protein